MAQKTQIKPTALLLVLVYLFLSGFMTVGAVQHDLIHEHHADHAKQHASLVCDWMCTASIFVHSADERLSAGVREPSFERLTIYAEPVLGHHSEFSFYIRPPPDFLA